MTGVRSFASSAPRVVLGSAAARSRELHEMDSALRTPLPISRRIAIVQESGGAGASATAGYVANLLARRRAGSVLGVDASAGSGMLWHGGVASSAETRPARLRRVARRTAEAVDGLPRSDSGLWARDLRAALGGGAPDRPASSEEWFAEVGPISRFFDLVVTDWGVREPGADLGRVVATSHLVCIVSRADRSARERAAAVASALAEAPGAPPVAVALVDVAGTARIETPAGIIARVPHDRAHGSGRPVASPALRTATRIAYLRLATELIRMAVGTVAPRTGEQTTERAVAGVATAGVAAAGAASAGRERS